MRPVEAQKIGEIIHRLGKAAVSPCVNLGSSTGIFRRQVQPHIDQYIFAPLRNKGVQIVHVDIKHGDGVDLAGDIFDARTVSAISRITPSCILCCNMFEHVVDKAGLADVIAGLLSRGGLLMVTVPRSYPIHYDPIDTYFRPYPEEILKLFPEFDLIEGGIISDSTYLQELVAKEGLAGTCKQFARSVIKFFMLWRGKRHWIGHFHRYFWLFRPYRVSYALMQKR